MSHHTRTRRPAVITVLQRALAALFGPTQPPPDPPAPDPPAPGGAVACQECGSSFVCPMSWAADGATGWRIDARCGECGTWAHLWLSNAQAAHWDVELDRQVAAISAVLEALETERARCDLEALVTAFERDLIGPADFAR